MKNILDVIKEKNIVNKKRENETVKMFICT